MVNSLLSIVCFNTVLFSCIFWVLTFIFKYYYSNKNCYYKLSFYECGFKSLTNIKIQYNINFVLIILFILIYDGEFLILIPFSLNIILYNFSINFLLFLFISLLIFTILFDLIYNSLEWQV